MLVGAVAALVSTAALGGAVGHSLLTWPVGVGLIVAWALATVLIAAVALVSRRTAERLGDAAALAAVAALALGLAQGSSGSNALVVLLAPLACVAAGAFVYRCAAIALRSLERLARGSSPLVRVALTGLARGPGLASLAIAMIAITVGLGGFALSYHATLDRSAADRAAAQVPLDARLAAGSSFLTPLSVATLDDWRALSHGIVLPIRRTVASYVSAGATVSVPALGVPASGLRLLHGWRQSDGSAPLAALGRALRTGAQPVYPALSASARWLSLRASSPALAAQLTADLRDADGGVTQVPIGTVDAAAELRAPIPPGHWELEALELAEPSGLQTTAGHQTAESGAPPAALSTTVSLGPITLLDGNRRPVGRVSVRGWHGFDAAGTVRFTTADSPEIVTAGRAERHILAARAGRPTRRCVRRSRPPARADDRRPVRAGQGRRGTAPLPDRA